MAGTTSYPSFTEPAPKCFFFWFPMFVGEKQPCVITHLSQRCLQGTEGSLRFCSRRRGCFPVETPRGATRARR